MTPVLMDNNSSRENSTGTNSSTVSSLKKANHEKRFSSPLNDGEELCPICLQNFLMPIELPQCKHKFCFLCIKGVALNTGKCALCRNPIPQSLITDPEDLLAVCKVPASKGSQIKQRLRSAENCQASSSRTTQLAKQCSSNETQPDREERKAPKWLYGGYKGWWEYDARTAIDIEKSYQRFTRSPFRDGSRPKSGSQSSGCTAVSLEAPGDDDALDLIEGKLEIVIAGFVYIIDFNNMVQYRKNLTGRSRKIKRVGSKNCDLKPDDVKGVSGIKIVPMSSVSNLKDDDSSCEKPANQMLDQSSASMTSSSENSNETTSHSLTKMFSTTRL